MTSNGSKAKPQAAFKQTESDVRRTSEIVGAAGLLNVAGQLSRKLSWALSTAWETGTGRKAPRGLINDMASRYATQITLELAESLPLHLTTLPGGTPEQEVDKPPDPG